MPSAANHIADILHNASVGMKPPTAPPAGGWAIFLGKMGDTPDRQIVCYDTGGEAPFSPVLLVDFPHVQVSVRGDQNKYVDTYARAREVKDALLGRPPVNVSDGRIDGITIIGDINTLGYDTKERPVFSVNFRVIFEPIANVYGFRESP